MIKMDSLDFLILSELLKDATLSLAEIAKKVGTSPYTVRRRFARLKEEGIIVRSIVSIDLAKLGYQGKAFLLISVSPAGDKSKAIAYLKKVQNIIVVTELVGPYDILAIAPITDLNSIQTLVAEAKRTPDVLLVKLACVDDTHFPVSQNLGTMLSQKSYATATLNALVKE